MRKLSVRKVIDNLKREYPTLAMEEEFSRDAYKLLAAVMLSARSRDVVTIPTAKKLFAVAGTPEKMARMPRRKVEEIIRPNGFFRQKAKNLIEMSKSLVERYEGKVPDSREGLTDLPGVGRKTAHVVLGQHFKKDVIAVDVHVHRISNRLGWVSTIKPEETEKELRNVVPKRYWNTINKVFVRHGQEVCLPRVPRCSKCQVRKYCPRVGVIKSS